VLSYPFTVGIPPKKTEPLVIRKAWATRLAVFSAAAGFAFVGAAFGAVLILRRVRRDFAEQTLNNLAELLTAEVNRRPKAGPDG